MWRQPPRLSGQGAARPNYNRINMPRKRITLSIFLTMLLLVSCSPREFLTRRLATDLISASSQLNTPQRFVLQTGVLSSKNYPSPEYLVLEHHGWISANPTPCPRDFTPPPCWDLLLTPSGVDAVRAALPTDQGGGSLLSLPIARRELVGVNGIAKQGNSADVDFTWRWVPLNEIGAALYSGDVHYKSVVGFRNYDDGWRMIDGVPHAGQSFDDALKNAEPIP
jgi:hypothetical protein